MTTLIRNIAAVAVVFPLLGSCAGPSVTLPSSGQWQWMNTSASYETTIDQDKLACSVESEAIQSRLRQCATFQPQNCDALIDNVSKALCHYSNSTTKNICDTGRMAIPKQEILDGCIAARGWKQVWIKGGG